jgi:hypothetical protein
MGSKISTAASRARGYAMGTSVNNRSGPVSILSQYDITEDAEEIEADTDYKRVEISLLEWDWIF